MDQKGPCEVLSSLCVCQHPGLLSFHISTYFLEIIGANGTKFVVLILFENLMSAKPIQLFDLLKFQISFSQRPYAMKLLLCRNVPHKTLKYFVNKKFKMTTTTEQSYDIGQYEKNKKNQI